MKLKEALENNDLTAMEVSYATGIKYNTLLCYKNGRRKISVKNAKILGKFLGVNWWEFFEDEKEENRWQ